MVSESGEAMGWPKDWIVAYATIWKRCSDVSKWPKRLFGKSE
jgi:hypothetical protein